VTRDHDVVLFGATGFTGSLTAEYLAAQSGVHWALAGRNAEKLAALRDRIGADVPILVADSTDAASLRRIAERAHVVATTVGPYALRGEPLVAACADTGTDYVDLAGEPDGSPVADAIASPNGMIVTPDSSTLIVAESVGPADSPRSISMPTVACPTDDGRHTRAMVLPTASASMPRVPSGTATCRTDGAFGSARAGRCRRRSSRTGARSRACSAVLAGRRCSSWRLSGAASRRWKRRSLLGPVRC
jgi:hypothetical protein